jgi:hypothetical protein
VNIPDFRAISLHLKLTIMASSVGVHSRGFDLSVHVDYHTIKRIPSMSLNADSVMKITLKVLDMERSPKS